jgi:hypothetical protein
MPTEEEGVRELLHQMYRSAENAPWDASPETIRSQHRRRIVPRPDLKALVLVAAAVTVALIVTGFLTLSSPTAHKVASNSTTTVLPSTTSTSISGHRMPVPSVVGLSQAQAATALGAAGLEVGTISLTPSPVVPAGTVISANPTAGSLVAPGTRVSLAVSSGPSATQSASKSSTSTSSAPVQPAPAPSAASAGVPDQQNCASGNATVSLTSSSPDQSTCVKLGAMLTVDLTSSGGWSGYGQFSVPPTVSDSSIVRTISYSPSGKTATADFHAVGTGTATVTVNFSVTCAPGDTTPCTVPPEEFFDLTVTVVAA